MSSAGFLPCETNKNDIPVMPVMRQRGNAGILPLHTIKKLEKKVNARFAAGGRFHRYTVLAPVSVRESF